MAEFMKHIVALLLLLIASIGIANCARQKSPLLIEDEGNRRNRPAGEFLTINLSQLFLDSRHSKIVNNKFRFSRIPDNDDGKVGVTIFTGQDML